MGGKPLDVSEIQHPVILFYRQDACPKDRLYDETRQFWALSQKKIKERNLDKSLKYQYAFAMRGNFVLEIYKVLQWYEAGTTVSSRPCPQDGKKQLWEFVGAIAEKEIGEKYRNRSLMRGDSPLHATQIGFRYLG